MSDTPKLIVPCGHKTFAGRHQEDGATVFCRGWSEPTVEDIMAWLQEQNVGEEVEANQKWFGVAKHPIPYMKPGRYLVIPLGVAE